MTPRYKKLAVLMTASAMLAGYSIPFAGPAKAQAANVAASAYTDLADAGNYRTNVEALLNQQVLHGYEDHTIRPNKPVSRAELAKLLVLGLKLEQAAPGSDDGYSDVEPNEWFHSYVATLTKHNINFGKNDRLQPNVPVKQGELVDVLAKLLKKDQIELQAWIDNYNENRPATRALVAHVILLAQSALPSEAAQVTEIKPLNSVALQVTFSKPLTADEVNLDNASKNFKFNNGLSIVNVPQLKTGATATYIVPTTTQKEGVTYELQYQNEAMVSFTGTGEKIKLNNAQQVSNDTFEIVSNRADGVVDYGYVIAAYKNGRGALAMELDANNSSNGVTYEIIPSLRSRTATLTPSNGGQPITVNYVPFTQSTDGRQEAKFRLPQGTTLQPGVTYTVTSDWMEVNQASFTAKEIAPLAVQSAKAVSNTSLELSLTADPQDELFAGRSVTLTAQDGSTLTATYQFSSRKGATGTFNLANNGTLKSGTTYTVTSVGGWATADKVSFTAN